jgi:hypothetical protein
MTTTRIATFLIALLFATTILGQVELKVELEKIEVLGIKQSQNHVIVLSCGNSKNSINLTCISAQGNIKWETTVDVPKVSGHRFNQLEVLSSSSSVFVINQLSERSYVTELDALNGNVIYKLNPVEISNNDAFWFTKGSDLLVSLSTENTQKMYNVTQNGLQRAASVLSIEEKYNNSNLRSIAATHQSIITTTYTLERNHGKMHLLLSKYNFADGSIQNKELDLTLDHTSYTYNSTIDNRVYGVHQTESNFYLIGKLDVQFKNKYPTKKMGDNFIGIWIAKFNKNLELQYFSEIPFQYFNGIIPADVIKKPSVVDVKEDFNSGLFVNISELKGVIYGNMYITYLDSLGLQKSISGGMDEYNFMEYDVSGLRDAGRKSKVRLMHDDWSPYATNIFNVLNHRPQDYSVVAENTIGLSRNSRTSMYADKSFNYLLFPESVLYFEYVTRKKGSLNVYRQPLK